MLLEKMKRILAEQFPCEEDSIPEETNFHDDLDADSLDLFELVMSLEEEYSIEISADDLTNLKTVGSVIKYLKGKGVES